MEVYSSVNGVRQCRAIVHKLYTRKYVECERCDGTGIVNETFYTTERGGDDSDGGEQCPDCKGQGGETILECCMCKGKKKRKVETHLINRETGLPIYRMCDCPACLGEGQFDEDEVVPEDERM